MFKSLGKATSKAVEGNTWKKFSQPNKGRGKTVFPSTSVEQERLGIRWDYDGLVTKPDGQYHKYQMQPNAGKIPTSIKQWREANGGTHAVMATVLVKEGSTQDEVKKALDEAARTVRG